MYAEHRGWDIGCKPFEQAVLSNVYRAAACDAVKKTAKTPRRQGARVAPKIHKETERQ
jgi:hypothetical protein